MWNFILRSSKLRLTFHLPLVSTHESHLHAHSCTHDPNTHALHQPASNKLLEKKTTGPCHPSVRHRHLTPIIIPRCEDPPPPHPFLLLDGIKRWVVVHLSLHGSSLISSESIHSPACQPLYPPPHPTVSPPLSPAVISPWETRPSRSLTADRTAWHQCLLSCCTRLILREAQRVKAALWFRRSFTGQGN